MKTLFALLLMTTSAYSQTVNNNATVNIQGANQNVSITQSGARHSCVSLRCRCELCRPWIERGAGQGNPGRRWTTARRRQRYQCRSGRHPVEGPDHRVLSWSQAR